MHYSADEVAASGSSYNLPGMSLKLNIVSDMSLCLQFDDSLVIRFWFVTSVIGFGRPIITGAVLGMTIRVMKEIIGLLQVCMSDPQEYFTIL